MNEIKYNIYILKKFKLIISLHCRFLLPACNTGDWHAGLPYGPRLQSAAATVAASSSAAATVGAANGAAAAATAAASTHSSTLSRSFASR